MITLSAAPYKNFIKFFRLFLHVSAIKNSLIRIFKSFIVRF